MAVLAASDAEIEDAKWSFTAVANVNTQVNIRAGASTDSAIVGYLPKAATAEVIERGKEWTHIISGGVEGYIKDEFLAYGDEAKRLAGVYGIPGVEVSWDDVNMFSRPDCCSSVLKKAKGGSEYTPQAGSRSMQRIRRQIRAAALRRLLAIQRTAPQQVHRPQILILIHSQTILMQIRLLMIQPVQTPGLPLVQTSLPRRRLPQPAQMLSLIHI